MLTQNQRVQLMNRILNDNRSNNLILTTRGNSMRPFLKEGIQIFRKIEPRRPPTVGDVAAVKFRNGFLVHRILMTRRCQNRRQYFTKGDRRLVGDGWVGEDRIAGIMIRQKRYQRIMDLAAAGFSALLWCGGKLLRRRRK